MGELRGVAGREAVRIRGQVGGRRGDERLARGQGQAGGREARVAGAIGRYRQRAEERPAREAMVLNTGTGIHVIPRFDPAVELTSAAEQHRFATLVRAVQCSLPADPHAPGITGLTRAVGSVNSKNGATVEVLRPGEPIDPGAVGAFVERLLKAPFRTVATILLGDERVLPCPVCRGEGTRLDVLDHAGMCYARCGKVTLAMLFDCVFRPLPTARKAGEEGAVEPASKRRPGKARPAK